MMVLGVCDGSAERRVVADAVIESRPLAESTRIVSAVPAMTELIVALGAADRLVARTAYDTDARLAHLPSFGRTLAPGAEAVLAHRPDLVIVDAESPSLEAAGLRVYVADVQTIADVGSAVERLGHLLGVRERADSLRHALEAGLEAVRTAVAGRSPPRVLYLIWPDPPQSAGPGTFIDEVIAAAGGRNVLERSRIRWPQVSLEEIIARDPEVLVLADGGNREQFRALHDAPGWRELSAIRDGRVIHVDPDLFHRPGPRVVEAVRALATALHPDVRFQ